MKEILREDRRGAWRLIVCRSKRFKVFKGSTGTGSVGNSKQVYSKV